MSVLSRYKVTPAPTAAAALTPMQHLDQICNQISLEAFATNSIGQYLNRKGAVLSAAFREALGDLLSRDHTRPELVNVAPLTRFVGTLDYTELSSVIMNKPVGFTGNFEGYAKFMNASILDHLTGLITQVLVPAQKRFGYYLNNPGEIKQRHGFEYGSQYSLETLLGLIQAQTAYVTEGNHTAVDEFGNLWDNSKAFLSTAALINTLNAERYRKASPELVNKEVQKLATVADRLLTQLTTQGGEASGAFVEAISEELRGVAKWVEWFSATTVQCIDATTAMKLNENVILGLGK